MTAGNGFNKFMRRNTGLGVVAAAVLICSFTLRGAPPDRGAQSDGGSSSLLKSGRPIPVGLIPGGPTVTARPLDVLLRERGDVFLQSRNPVADAGDILTATGGPTSCELDVECDDCNPCTLDSCDTSGLAGVCTFVSADLCSPCDDGLFCNGTNKCDGTLDPNACLDPSNIKQWQCVAPDANEDEVCFDMTDSHAVCANAANCQLVVVDPDPCRFFDELICDEEEPSGVGATGACVTPCDTDADCDDFLACNGAETCLKDPSTLGSGGVCGGDTTSPGAPCTVVGDCTGADPICQGVCRFADERPCGRNWGGSIVTCAGAVPVVCGPGRCCTPDGNDWTCSRATKAACETGGGMFLGVGDLATSDFDDADIGNGECLPEADESFPDPGESFLCPKYSAGVITGDIVAVEGRAGAAVCNPYWEFGDDYTLSNCKKGNPSWYERLTIRWVGGHVRGRGSRMRISFYTAEGLFVEDRITGGAFPGGITRNTVIFDQKPVIPCSGIMTIKPASSFSPDNQVEWGVTDTVQVGSTDSMLYGRKHGYCAGDVDCPNRLTAGGCTPCNIDSDCGAEGPCTITSGVNSADDGVALKGGPLVAFAVPDGGAGLAFELAGAKVDEPTGACCNLNTGDCDAVLPWICEERGDFFQGTGTTCNICSNDIFRGCDQAEDCFVCDGGGNDLDLCGCPDGACVADFCVGGGRNGQPCDCPDGTCNGEPATCLPVPPACQVSACCGKTDGSCVEVTGNHCVGGANDGNPCNSTVDCLPLGSCFFASGTCLGGVNNTLDCIGDVECPGGECIAPCPPETNSLGFGTKCKPNCCVQVVDTGADLCTEAAIVVINVPVLGQPPVTYTWTSNNKAATFGDFSGGTCTGGQLDPAGGFRDRGWWHAFSIDDCADIRIDHCCTFEIDGQIHQPAWAFLYLDCNPCTALIGTDIVGIGSFPPEPIGEETRAVARGGPFCDFDDLWHTYGPIPKGIYYYTVYSGTGGHFGEYQLHVTVGACSEAACCLPSSVCVGPGGCPGGICTANVCVGGANDGLACTATHGLGCGTNDDCAPLKGDKVCTKDDANRPNQLCCPGGFCDNDQGNPTCTGGMRAGLACCDGGGECKGQCITDCIVNRELDCDELDGYWHGFGNLPLGVSATTTCGLPGSPGICERGACCVGPGECNEDRVPNCTANVDCCDDGAGKENCIDRKLCITDNGTFIGGARCQNPKNPCPACEIEGDANCHVVDGVRNFGVISDLSTPPGGVVQADDVILSGGQIDQVCVTGIYMDPISPNDPDSFDCSGNVEDDFRVRFYADDGNGRPDHTNILAEAANLTIANGGVSKSDTQIPTSAGMLAELYTLSFPTMNLPSGVRIWLEVTNNTDTPTGAPGPVDNTCWWHWMQTSRFLSGFDYNGWLYTGTDYRPLTGSPQIAYPDRAGETGYGDAGHGYSDLVFCLGNNGAPANFTEPPEITGSCCACDGVCDNDVTFGDCYGEDGPDSGSADERRWKRGGVCPEACLEPGVPLEGDDCGAVAAGTAAVGTDCTPPFPEPGRCVTILDGRFEEQSVCATDSILEGFAANSFLGRDFFACYFTTCTGKLTVSMCNSGMYYNNQDTYLAVYHDFDNPTICPCPVDARTFLVKESDEGCNGLPDGGAGIMTGQIVVPGECWLARIGGWGATIEVADRGITRVDVGCSGRECPQTQPPLLQTQFGAGLSAGADEPKNRYIAVKGGGACVDPLGNDCDNFLSQTIRVKWQSMPNWPGGHLALNGTTRWILEPTKICENSGVATGPSCPVAPGQPQRWFWFSRTTGNSSQAWFGDLTTLANWCTRGDETCDPTEPNTCAFGTCGVDGVIHIGHQNIVPSKRNPSQPAVYHVQSIAECDLTDENNFSAPLILTNPIFGDVLLNNGSCPTGPPNNNGDISDVVGVLNKFSNNPCAPKKTRADMQPATPDLKVGIPDVLQSLNGFQGRPYEFAAVLGRPEENEKTDRLHAGR